MKTLRFLFALVFIPSISLAQVTLEDVEGLGKIQRNNKKEISYYKMIDKERSFTDHVDFFKTILNISKNDEFRLFEKGKSFEEYRQYFNGVRVKNGVFVLHRNNGIIKSANGNYIRVLELDTKPTITREQALERWCNYLKIPVKDVRTFNDELLVVDINEYDEDADQSRTVLAFRIRLYTKHPSNTLIGFVDAHSGNVLLTEPLALPSSTPTTKPVLIVNSSPLDATLLPPATGTFATRYNGTKTATTESRNNLYYLEDWTRGEGIETLNLEDSDAADTTGAVSFSDNDNSWTEYDNEDYDNAALDVHWALQKVYDFFEDEYSRSGWDSAGKKIDAYIHAIIDGTRDNAAYYDGEYLAFGDGQSNFYPFVSLDAVAHEYAHGINDHTSNFGISGLVRSLNEGLSDIWAAVIENYVAPQKNNWWMFDEITRDYECERNIEDPDDSNARWEIADTYGTTEYNDNSEEYYRSGIMSHWFYRLSEGGSGINGLGNSYTVYGLDIEEAANLVYHAQAERYLNGTSTYTLMRTNMLAASDNLFGENSIQSLQVANAWYAVGVGSNPGQITITGPSLVCNTNSTFTLHDLPTGATCAWSFTSGIVTPSSGNDTIATFHGTSCSQIGEGDLIFTISQGGGSVQISKRDIIVNGPDYSDVTLNVLDSYGQDIPDQSLLCPYTTYHMYIHNNSSCSTSNYTWDIPSGWTLHYTYNDMASINTNDSPWGNVVVKAQTCCAGCGSTVEIHSAYFSEDYDCGQLFTIYPNPAGSYVDIDINKGNDLNLNRDKEFSLTVTDINGIVKYTGRVNGLPYRLNTVTYKDGIYIVNIGSGVKTWSSRFMIKH